MEDGVSVNRGCVLQTHLFHDRIMRMDEIKMGKGSRLDRNPLRHWDHSANWGGHQPA